MPALAQRWHARAAALGTAAAVTTHAGTRASWIAAFPEAVALAAILTDLDLRRHIALQWDDRPLYKRISASIGEQRYQAWAYHNAPVRRWIRIHRARFEQLRNRGLAQAVPGRPNASNDLATPPSASNPKTDTLNESNDR